MFLAVPVKVSFRQNKLIPVVDVCITSNVAQSPGFLLEHTIRIIEGSEQFKGILLDSSPCFFTSATYAVAFSIIFPSVDVCKKFVECNDGSAKN